MFTSLSEFNDSFTSAINLMNGFIEVSPDGQVTSEEIETLILDIVGTNITLVHQLSTTLNNMLKSNVNVRVETIPGGFIYHGIKRLEPVAYVKPDDTENQPEPTPSDWPVQP